ncbi:MAG TPA: O-antigen ligase family protein, partial [Chitinophagaceae bacterium]
PFISAKTRALIMQVFCGMVSLAAVYAFVNAFTGYVRTGDSSLFTYHALVRNYFGHAVQYSILVFVAVTQLVEKNKNRVVVIHRQLDRPLILLLAVFLFLLSSKLVIVVFLVYVAWTLAVSLKQRNKVLLGVAMIVTALVVVTIFATNNRISNRFRDIAVTDFSFLSRKIYSPGEYFNGLEFRLLQWRYVPSILSRKHAWLTGVGIGDAQHLLDSAYRDARMYTGDAARGDRGFLGYNTHDELLQSLLESGLAGAIIFLAIIAGLVKMTWEKRRLQLTFVTGLVAVYSFSEAVFETQYSAMIFLLFPLLLYFDGESTSV